MAVLDGLFSICLGRITEEKPVDTQLLPGVNVVAICPDLKLRNTLIRAIQAMSGISPVMKSDSESAQRAHYAPAISRLIINTASAAMHAKLGKHSVALAVVVEDRVAGAERARAVFENAGYVATVHTQAEPEFPDGFLTFVAAPDLDGITLMCWPRPQDVTEELRRTLPRNFPWTPADLEIAE